MSEVCIKALKNLSPHMGNKPIAAFKAGKEYFVSEEIAGFLKQINPFDFEILHGKEPAIPAPTPEVRPAQPQVFVQLKALEGWNEMAYFARISAVNAAFAEVGVSGNPIPRKVKAEDLNRIKNLLLNGETEAAKDMATNLFEEPDSNDQG